MKSWKNGRPPDWDNPYYKIPEGNDRCVPSDQGAFEFEAGADAMYEPAYKKGIRDSLEWMKTHHYIVGYDLEDFIKQLEAKE